MGVTASMMGAAAALCSNARSPCCQDSCRWVGHEAAVVLYNCHSHSWVLALKRPKAQGQFGTACLYTLVQYRWAGYAQLVHSSNSLALLVELHAELCSEVAWLGLLAGIACLRCFATADCTTETPVASPNPVSGLTAAGCGP